MQGYKGTGSKMLFLVQNICVCKANFVIISANIFYTTLCISEVLYASYSILKSIRADLSFDLVL